MEIKPNLTSDGLGESLSDAALPPLPNQQVFLESVFSAYQSNPDQSPFKRYAGEYQDELSEYLKDNLRAARSSIDAATDWGPTDSQLSRLLSDSDYRATLTGRLSQPGSRSLGKMLGLWDEGLRAYSENLYAADRDSDIPVGLLDSPPFYNQTSIYQCDNAIFRMIFAGVTGYSLDENTVSRALRVHRSVPPFDLYASAFATPSFKDIYPAKVTMVDITGASLNDVSVVASKCREKSPDAKIYCAATLGTTTDRAYYRSLDVTRAIVLQADNDQITCHYPGMGSGESMSIGREEFVKRWAMGYNRACLFIARPVADNAPTNG